MLDLRFTNRKDYSFDKWNKYYRGRQNGLNNTCPTYVSLNLLTPWAFYQFLDILEIFRLDMDQISSNLLIKAFVTCQHAFLSTSKKYKFKLKIDLLLGLLPVQKIRGKHHSVGQLLPWSSHVYLQEILLSSSLNFLRIFRYTSGSINWLLCSEYHRKDLILLQRLSIDDAHFGQRRGCQK